MQKIMSAKQNVCKLLFIYEAFYESLNRISPEKINLPLIRGVDPLECPLIGERTVAVSF